MRLVRLSLVAALCALAVPSGPVAAAAPVQTHSLTHFDSTPTAHVAPDSLVMTISARSDAAPLGDLSGPANLTLAFAGAVGAAGAAKTKKRNLSQAYLFGGVTYGPGDGIDVPEDFPDIDGESGEPVHPEGSTAARNLASSRRTNTNSFASPPSTGGVNTGEPAPSEPRGTGKTVSGKTQAELDGMTKTELMDLAETAGVTVERMNADGDIEEGEPLVGDYRRVLGATAVA